MNTEAIRRKFEAWCNTDAATKVRNMFMRGDDKNAHSALYGAGYQRALKDMEATKASDWIRVEDRLPEKSTLVLIKVRLPLFTSPIELVETYVTAMLDDKGWLIANDITKWDYDYNYVRLEIIKWKSI